MAKVVAMTILTLLELLQINLERSISAFNFVLLNLNQLAGKTENYHGDLV